jgi:hypothetical protein
MVQGRHAVGNHRRGEDTSMATDDGKVIAFPGSRRPAAAAAPPAPAPSGAPAGLPEGLSEDQGKAVGIVLSGMTFVLVGIKPTDRGADFFTAVHGAPEDLRNAHDHLAGVISRALGRKGIVT